MEITHPLTATAPIVVLASGLGQFLSRLERALRAHLGCHVSALIAESQAAVEPRFYSFSPHADAHTALCDLIPLSAKLQSVIVADRGLLDMAQNRRELVLGANRPVRMCGIAGRDSEALIPFGQELAFEISIGLFQRIRAA